MKKKLWLDDIRTPPDDTWHWAKTAEDAIHLLFMYDFDIVSLDHDLGEIKLPPRDGYAVAKYIEHQAHCGFTIPPDIRIHSANPVGRQRMKAAIDSARSWERQVKNELSKRRNSELKFKCPKCGHEKLHGSCHKHKTVCCKRCDDYEIKALSCVNHSNGECYLDTRPRHCIGVECKDLLVLDDEASS